MALGEKGRSSQRINWRRAQCHFLLESCEQVVVPIILASQMDAAPLILSEDTLRRYYRQHRKHGGNRLKGRNYYRTLSLYTVMDSQPRTREPERNRRRNRVHRYRSDVGQEAAVGSDPELVLIEGRALSIRRFFLQSRSANATNKDNVSLVIAPSFSSSRSSGGGRGRLKVEVRPRCTSTTAINQST